MTKSNQQERISPFNYDSSWETLAHIRRVQDLLFEVSKNIRDRATNHDLSKLESPEKELFDEMTPKLKGCTYGSEEYKDFLGRLAPALKNHYDKNDHHPEHYPDGIAGMNLLSLLEMICDWKAAGERHADGSLEKSFDINSKRFNISPELLLIMKNTAIELGMMDSSTVEHAFKLDSPISPMEIRQKIVEPKDVNGAIARWFETPYQFSTNDRKMFKPIYLALQYCPLDREQAMASIRLLCSMEATPREDVRFVVVHRDDCKPPDDETMAILKGKFPKTEVWRSQRGSRGHPAGCNGMWIDTMTMAAEAGHRTNIEGIFTFEPDCVPIRRDWIDKVKADWRWANRNGRRVVGHLMSGNSTCPEHVNGNMLVHTQVLRGIPQISQCPPNQAWDLYAAKFFRPHWLASNFIHNLYKHTNVPQERILELQRGGTAIIHGVKDQSIFNVVKDFC